MVLEQPKNRKILNDFFANAQTKCIFAVFLQIHMSFHLLQKARILPFLWGLSQQKEADNKPSRWEIISRFMQVVTPLLLPHWPKMPLEMSFCRAAHLEHFHWPPSIGFALSLSPLPPAGPYCWRPLWKQVDISSVPIWLPSWGSTWRSKKKEGGEGGEEEKENAQLCNPRGSAILIPRFILQKAASLLEGFEVSFTELPAHHAPSTVLYVKVGWEKADCQAFHLPEKGGKTDRAGRWCAGRPGAPSWAQTLTWLPPAWLPLSGGSALRAVAAVQPCPKRSKSDLSWAPVPRAPHIHTPRVSPRTEGTVINNWTISILPHHTLDVNRRLYQPRLRRMMDAVHVHRKSAHVIPPLPALYMQLHTSPYSLMALTIWWRWCNAFEILWYCILPRGFWNPGTKRWGRRWGDLQTSMLAFPGLSFAFRGSSLSGLCFEKWNPLISLFSLFALHSMQR